MEKGLPPSLGRGAGGDKKSPNLKSRDKRENK